MTIDDAASSLAYALGVTFISVARMGWVDDGMNLDVYTDDGDDLTEIEVAECEPDWPDAYRIAEGVGGLCAHRSRFLVEVKHDEDLEGGWGVSSGERLVSAKPEAVAVYGGEIMVLARPHPGTA